MWDRMKGLFSLTEPTPQDSRRINIHYSDIGSSGIQSYGGYPSEEYLIKIKGTLGADIYDQMRRSDPNIVMVLSLVSNLIKGASWSFEKADNDEESERQAELINHIFFNCLDQPWTQKLGEILTYLIYGHAAFEVTHKPIIGHPDFGNFIAIKSLSWRSPKTIDRFNLDPQTGNLLSITQLAYGDLLRNVTIPAEYLVLFTHMREGSMYEGISALRPVYGSWLRKNTYLKLMAIGMEKYAVPTPILDVPEGKENSEQFEQAIEVLKMYTTHQSAYLTKPAEWKLDFSETTFEPQKLKEAIDFENSEMVRAFLANFMLLGSGGGGGSYALSNDLSDFFLGGIEYIANYICEELNRCLIPSMVDLNFGPQKKYPKLKATGIRDRAGKELAEVIQLLVNARALTPDSDLEKELRRRYKLPEKQEVDELPLDPAATQPDPAAASAAVTPPTPAQLAELKLADTPRTIIVDKKPELKDLMQKHMKAIGTALKDQIMAGYNNLPESQRFNAIKNLTPTGVATYKAELLNALAEISFISMNGAREEVGLKHIKLSEFDELPPTVKKRIKALAELLSGSQSDDLVKHLSFVYLSNVDSIQGAAAMNKLLDEAVTILTLGPTTTVGSGNITAQVVNETRAAIFLDPEVDSEIESYTFKNPDPITPICQSLVGVVFAKNDPDLNQYRPPLHHNCKSYLSVNLKGGRPKEVTDKADYMPGVMKNIKYITLAEEQVSGLVLQAVQVSKKLALSLEDAKRFAKEYAQTVDMQVESDMAYRFQQKDIGLFVEGSLKTFEPIEGVILIMGTLKPL